MAKKDLELRPVMTRIPEGLRRELAHEAKRHGRSMNGEIIDRLAMSFSKYDQIQMAERIVSDIETALYSVTDQLNEVQSQIRTILSHLGLPDPAAKRDFLVPRAKDDGEPK